MNFSLFIALVTLVSPMETFQDLFQSDHNTQSVDKEASVSLIP